MNDYYYKKYIKYKGKYKKLVGSNPSFNINLLFYLDNTYIDILKNFLNNKSYNDAIINEINNIIEEIKIDEDNKQYITEINIDKNLIETINNRIYELKDIICKNNNISKYIEQLEKIKEIIAINNNEPIEQIEKIINNIDYELQKTNDNNKNKEKILNINKIKKKIQKIHKIYNEKYIINKIDEIKKDETKIYNIITKIDKIKTEIDDIKTNVIKKINYKIRKYYLMPSFVNNENIKIDLNIIRVIQIKYDNDILTFILDGDTIINDFTIKETNYTKYLRINDIYKSLLLFSQNYNVEKNKLENVLYLKIYENIDYYSFFLLFIYYVFDDIKNIKEIVKEITDKLKIDKKKYPYFY